MKCPKCGNTVGNEDIFCGKCGYKLKSRPEEAKKTVFGIAGVDLKEMAKGESFKSSQFEVEPPEHKREIELSTPSPSSKVEIKSSPPRRSSFFYEELGEGGPNWLTGVIMMILSLGWITINDTPIFPLGFLIAIIVLFSMTTSLKFKHKFRQIKTKLLFSFIFCIVGVTLFGIWLHFEIKEEGFKLRSPLVILPLRVFFTPKLTIKTSQIVSGVEHSIRSPAEIRLGEKVCFYAELENFSNREPMILNWQIEGKKDNKKITIKEGREEIDVRDGVLFRCLHEPLLEEEGNYNFVWGLSQKGYKPLEGKEKYVWTGPKLINFKGRLGISGVTFFKDKKTKEVKRPEVFIVGKEVPFSVWIDELQGEAKVSAEVYGEVKCPETPPQNTIITKRLMGNYNGGKGEEGIVKVDGEFVLPEEIEISSPSNTMNCVLYLEVIDKNREKENSLVRGVPITVSY